MRIAAGDTVYNGTFDECLAAIRASVDEAEFRAWALAYLNTWRGQRRATLGLTSADFQELVYTGKVLECQRWLAAPDTPFGMALEAAARGITNTQMAELVLGQHQAWAAASDEIEALYITALKSINEASSLEEVYEALAIQATRFSPGS